MEELIDVLRTISSHLAEMNQLLKSAGLTNKDRATLNAMQDRLLSGVEAARMLGCSPQTVIHMRRDGRIKAKATVAVPIHSFCHTLHPVATIVAR